ncbi:MAG: hypothetical protein MZV70_14110, partial [Desulfobacterales bacterium]|nr:hypothetical protein [Desulfobacterales bacterium]
MVKDKKIDGISDIRDESDKDGIRVVFELRKGTMSPVILNNLYKNTALEGAGVLCPSYQVNLSNNQERWP